MSSSEGSGSVRSFLARVLVILVFSGILAFFHFLILGQPGIFSASALSHVQWIEEKEAISLKDTLWVDARTRSDYEKAHKENAVLLNLEEWDGLLPLFLDAWKSGQPIVVYCSPGNCGNSQEVAARLAEAMPDGKIFVLKGGWAPAPFKVP